MKKRHEQKLLLLSLFLFVVWNAPILLLFDSSDPFLGVPKIYIFIFSVWIFSIALSYIITKRYNE